MTARLTRMLGWLALGALLAASPVQAERLIVSVSNHRVTVTPNYSGEELEIGVGDVQVGDVIAIRPGEKLPVDGEVS